MQVRRGRSTPGARGIVSALFLLCGLAHAQLNVARTIEPESYTVFGETLTVTLTFDTPDPTTLLSLTLTESIPPGWQFGTTLGNDGILLFRPDPGEQDELEWLWLTPPETFPASLQYTLVVPPGGSTGQSIQGAGAYDIGPDSFTFGPIGTTIPFNPNANPIASCVTEFTLDLDSEGNATLTVDDIDNGSQDPEGAPLQRVLSRTEFTCADTGAPIPVTLTVTDDLGASDTCDTLVSVRDVTPPAVTLIGDSSITLSCGVPFNDPGAIATDQCAGALPIAVTGDTAILDSPPAPGQYTLTYIAYDGANTGSVSRQVTVVDTTPPTMTLIGPTTAFAECGEPYTDPGATASDTCDGDLTGLVTVDTASLDVTTPGTYEVTIAVSDGSGNVDTAIRLITVRDRVAPILTLGGEDPVTIDCGTTYIDEGVAAFDACDNLIEHTTDSSAVDTSTPGTYTVQFSGTDDAGNTRFDTRTVIVTDLSPPVIQLLGPAELTVDCGTPYVDPGVVATDACEGDLTTNVTVGGDIVDTSPLTTGPAIFVVTYDVQDAAGNVAQQLTRTVIVAGDSCAADEVFVQTYGDDETGAGTASSPWRSIQFAIDTVSTVASADRPMTINIGAGDYPEVLTLAPHTTVRGANPSDPAATRLTPSPQSLDARSNIAIRGAPFAAIHDLRVSLPANASNWSEGLRIDNVPMTLSNVAFTGQDAPLSTGIHILGQGSSDTLILRCMFKNLTTGIRTADTHANLTQNKFLGISGDAVFVGIPGKGITGPTTPLLGDASRPLTTGFNEFLNIDGKFIESIDPSEILAENNAWGDLIDPEAVSEKLSGTVDIEPLIPRGDTHAADQDANAALDFSEMLRVVQLFNSDRYQCASESEDGYAPGTGSEVCIAHDSDYAPRDFSISLQELLRAIQIFNSESYARCDTGEDGFCPRLESD